MKTSYTKKTKNPFDISNPAKASIQVQAATTQQFGASLYRHFMVGTHRRTFSINFSS